MKQNTRYTLAVSGLEKTYKFDTFEKSFGTVISSTPTYDGIYRVVTGNRPLKLTLTGTLAREQLADYDRLIPFTGIRTDLTVDSVTYEGFALENVRAQFEAGSLLGKVTAVFTEVT